MNPEPPSNNFKPFALALLLSTVVNAAGIYTLTEMKPRSFLLPQKPKEIMLDLNSLSQHQTFVDTPPEAKPPEKDTDHLSDKDSRADSSKHGEETGLLPQSEKKDLLPQAQRTGPLSPATPPLLLQQQMQKALKKVETEQTAASKKMTTEGVQIAASKPETKSQDKLQKGTDNGEEDKKEDKEKPEDELLPTPEQNPLENVNLAVPPSKPADDLFALPIISLGDRTKSENGRDAFDAKGSDLGKYLKTMRDKIGLHFYKMVFFHYRTNYIFGSRAKASFMIEPAGSLSELKVKLVEGDPMFADYCETVIRNAEPFAPLHKGLAPYLEDGALKIDFLFGYDVRKDGNDKEQEKE